MTDWPGQSQPDLFGGLHSGADRPTVGRESHDSNDIDLMHTVAGNAIRCGYLLVGTAERVYTRTTSEHVARVPRYEEDAVHQLLRRHWLTLGGTHRVTCGAATLTGIALLVPKHVRVTIGRWERLQRPPTWPDQDRTPPGGEPGCALCHGTGRVPDSRQTRWTPDRGVHRPNTTSPCPWCPPRPQR